MYYRRILLAGILLTYFSYQLQPLSREYCGWRLRLLSDGVVIDERTFSIDPAQAAPCKGIRWWNAMIAEDRDYWMHTARSARPADAYRAFLVASAYIEAVAYARAWLTAHTEAHYRPHTSEHQTHAHFI